MTAVEQRENRKQFDAEKGVVYVSNKQTEKQLAFLIGLSLSKSPEIKISAIGTTIVKAMKLVNELQKRG